MTQLPPPKKDQIFDHLSRMKIEDAARLLKTNETSVKRIINSRRIGQENFDLVHADMLAKGVKVGPVGVSAPAETAEPPKTPNQLIQEDNTVRTPKEVTQLPEKTYETPEGITGLDRGISYGDVKPTEAIKMPDKLKAVGIAATILPTDSISSDLGDVLPPSPTDEEQLPPTVVVNEPWEGRKLMICFPCYRTTNPATMWALMGLIDKSKMMFALQSNTEIRNARNKLADTFLKSGCEWSFWLDDDMIPPFGNEPSYRLLTQLTKEQLNTQAAGQNTILRLVNTARQRGVKIVSGLYFGRNAKGRAMTAEGIASASHDRDSRNAAGKDVVKVTAWAATGCLLVHRDVFLTIKQQQPKPGEIYPFFNSDEHSGEDAAFGKKAKAAGFVAVVDHMIVVPHVGYSVYHHENTQFSVQ